MKLDELARTSATAARSSVSHLEPPEIGRRAAPTWVTPVLAGAAVTAVVVGGLLLLPRGDDGGAPADEPVPTLPADVVVPRLGITADGWEIMSAIDAGDVPGRPTRTFDYYGTAGADQPFAERDLLVAAGPVTEDEDLVGQPVELRGVTGYVQAGPDLGFRDGTTVLTWNEPGDLTVVLASAHLGEAELLAIAEGLRIDTATSSVEVDPSLGLGLVARDIGTPFEAVRNAADGYFVGYTSATDPESNVGIVTEAGDVAARVRAFEWWLGEPTAVSVSGSDGFLFDLDAMWTDIGLDTTNRLVVWAPAPGAVAQLFATGIDPALDVVELASSTFEIDDATWADYVDLPGGPIAPIADLDVTYGEGEGDVDGVAYSWALGEADGQRCFGLSTGMGGMTSCSEPASDAPPTPSMADQGTSEELGYAVIVADADTDEVSDATGSYRIERVDAVGLSWFVAVGPGDATPIFHVLRDGAIVGTVELGVPAAESSGAVSTGGPDPALADNPSAVELGVEDMQVVLRDGAGRIDLWLGTLDGDVCLVTDGAAVSAACRVASDVMVFRTDDTAEDDTLVVVLRDLPECIVGTGLSGPNVGGQASAGDGAHTYEVMWADEPLTAWTVDLVDRTGVVRELDLPDGLTEVSGDFPTDLCT